MNITEIWAEAAKLSANELRSLSKACLQRAEQKIRTTLNVGDRVEFYARGRTISGTIIGSGPKNFKVQPDGEFSHWRCPPSLLRKITVPLFNSKAA